MCCESETGYVVTIVGADAFGKPLSYYFLRRKKAIDFLTALGYVDYTILPDDPQSVDFVKKVYQKKHSIEEQRERFYKKTVPIITARLEKIIFRDEEM